jgi:hypothetical protein
MLGAAFLREGRLGKDGKTDRRPNSAARWALVRRNPRSSPPGSFVYSQEGNKLNIYE